MAVFVQSQSLTGRIVIRRFGIGRQLNRVISRHLIGQYVVNRAFRVVVMDLRRGANEWIEGLRGAAAGRPAAAILFLEFLQLVLQKPNRLRQCGQVHRWDVLSEEINYVARCFFKF